MMVRDNDGDLWYRAGDFSCFAEWLPDTRHGSMFLYDW